MYIYELQCAKLVIDLLRMQRPYGDFPKALNTGLIKGQFIKWYRWCIFQTDDTLPALVTWYISIIPLPSWGNRVYRRYGALWNYCCGIVPFLCPGKMPLSWHVGNSNRGCIVPYTYCMDVGRFIFTRNSRIEIYFLLESCGYQNM